MACPEMLRRREEKIGELRLVYRDGDTGPGPCFITDVTVGESTVLPDWWKPAAGGLDDKLAGRYGIYKYSAFDLARPEETRCDGLLEYCLLPLQGQGRVHSERRLSR